MAVPSAQGSVALRTTPRATAAAPSARLCSCWREGRRGWFLTPLAGFSDSSRRGGLRKFRHHGDNHGAGGRARSAVRCCTAVPTWRSRAGPRGTCAGVHSTTGREPFGKAPAALALPASCLYGPGGKSVVMTAWFDFRRWIQHGRPAKATFWRLVRPTLARWHLESTAVYAGASTPVCLCSFTRRRRRWLSSFPGDPGRARLIVEKGRRCRCRWDHPISAQLCSVDHGLMTAHHLLAVGSRFSAQAAVMGRCPAASARAPDFTRNHLGAPVKTTAYGLGLDRAWPMHPALAATARYDFAWFEPSISADGARLLSTCCLLLNSYRDVIATERPAHRRPAAISARPSERPSRCPLRPSPAGRLLVPPGAPPCR